MTDGIIAFNMKGEIIHINTASKKLLEIKEDENTFSKIFERLDVDINMEKIIYHIMKNKNKMINNKIINKTHQIAVLL